jgi:hypothetical protein
LDGTNQAYAVSLTAKAVKMASGMSVKPVGVHYDIEPATYASFYGLPWLSGNPQTSQIAGNYIALLKRIEAAAAGSGLKVDADIALSFATVTVTIGNRTSPLLDFAVNAVDETVLTDFRTSASNIESIADPFASYAAAAHKPLVIGVEIDPDGACPTCTFNLYGASAASQMNSALGAVETYYKGNPSFAGFAVESYGNYSDY